MNDEKNAFSRYLDNDDGDGTEVLPVYTENNAYSGYLPTDYPENT